MPLFAINLSDKLFASIKDLVEKGHYQTPESFLEIAAFNQLALERGATPAEIIERGHRKTAESASPVGNGVHQKKLAQPSMAAENGKASAAQRRNPKPIARALPDPESLPDHDIDLAFNRLAKVARSDGSPLPCVTRSSLHSSGRLFGQVNRLFPMKLACRWLATASAAERKWPNFEAISDRMADDAATVGSLLERWDNEASRKRDEQLSTGLPRRGNSSSRDRFLSQFVARLTRAGEIYAGAVCQYELVKFVDSAIVLTDQGLTFSEIENAVLDAKDTKTPTTLSAEEIDFLVHQVLTWVPTECNDMRIVLAAVKAGKTTPSDLTAAVHGQFPQEWTESTAVTHVSGLVARLAELQLLRRQWQGRHVTYDLGDRVEEFLKESLTEEHA
jgi:hypothetical protein